MFLIFQDTTNNDKRKREQKVKSSNEHLCKLSEIPQKKFGIIPRQHCAICKERNKNEKDKKKVSQTRYFCLTHNTPCMCIGML